MVSHDFSASSARRAKRVTRPFTVYSAFFVALVCFFLCTVLVVWLFLGTNNWVRLKSGAAQAHIFQPPSNESVWNDYVRFTNEGHYVVRRRPSRGRRKCLRTR